MPSHSFGVYRHSLSPSPSLLSSPPRQHPSAVDLDPQAPLILVCPDDNLNTMMLIQLLDSSNLCYYSVERRNSHSLVSFISIADFISARDHPNLRGFHTVTEDPKTNFIVLASNLPSNVTRHFLQDLLLTHSKLDIEIHSLNSNSSKRPSATITIQNRADYEKLIKRPVINFEHHSIFLSHLNQPSLHRTMLSGLPPSVTEPDLGRALILSKTRAVNWHIPLVKSGQRFTTAFVYFKSTDELESAIKSQLLIYGIPVHWVTSKSTCLECHQTGKIHLPFCSKLRPSTTRPTERQKK